jgi:hypothetical protein
MMSTRGITDFDRLLQKKTVLSFGKLAFVDLGYESAQRIVGVTGGAGRDVYSSYAVSV